MELPKPNNNRNLFLDMNSFFASCEQSRRPELRGRPVAVTPTLAPSGCVIAASYAAKKLGVSTGCRISEALEKCPDIAIVSSDPAYYVTIHRQIAKIIESVTPFANPESIDEFSIRVTPLDRADDQVLALADKLKVELYRSLSPALLCSIGIGPNRFTSKLGTELQKPDGLVHITLERLPNIYRNMPLRTLPGINYGLESRLNLFGIRSARDFFVAPIELLNSILGFGGEVWWYRLHGYEVPLATRPTKSISHSHVLAPELRTKKRAWGVVYKLMEKVAQRLRAENLTAQEFSFYINNLNGQSWSCRYKITPIDTIGRLLDKVRIDYNNLPDNIKPLKCYVCASRLALPAPVLPLFVSDNKRSCMGKISDSINQKYGRWTIQPASLFEAGSAAPNRISFGAVNYEMD